MRLVRADRGEGLLTKVLWATDDSDASDHALHKWNCRPKAGKRDRDRHA
jgi:hypothetical protein